MKRNVGHGIIFILILFYLAAYLPPNNCEDFGESDNLGKNENDSVVFSNTSGYSTIGFCCIPPTDGEVIFEGSFDGINYESITLRGINSDVLSNTASTVDNYVGSIAGLRLFRARTSTVGSANGTIMGRGQRDAAIIETVEFDAPPHKFGYVPIHKNASYTDTQTNSVIWDVTSDKKFVITDLIITCSGNTDAQVKVFDETDSDGNYIFKGTIDVSNNKQFSFNHSFVTPFIADANNNSLKVTTSAGIDIDIVVHGYEK